MWVLYYSSASLLAFMALVGANVRSGSFAHLDKAARSVAILMSLYWIISYFPTVQQDYKNKNGDVRLTFPSSIPKSIPSSLLPFLLLFYHILHIWFWLTGLCP